LYRKEFLCNGVLSGVWKWLVVGGTGGDFGGWGGDNWKVEGKRKPLRWQGFCRYNLHFNYLS